MGAGPATAIRPGDLVGRLRSAALRVDDPRVSEVHAYVSLRDGALKLLALRGGLALAGQLVREVTLAPGVVVQLAHEVTLEVLDVHHPEHLLALEGFAGPQAEGSEGGRKLPREVLTGAGVSILLEPTVHLVGRIVPGAAAHLWTDGEGWVCQIGANPPRPIEAGQELPVGAAIRVVAVPRPAADAAGTAAHGRLDAPLRIEGSFDTARFVRAGDPVLVLGGAAGRLVCELGAIGQPVYWASVAAAVWPDGADTETLRKRWDVLMVRVRRRLDRAGVRADLIRSDGTGHVQLSLRPEDRFVDRS